MDYLFVQLMLWGKAQGYGRFDLGMAPLSGLQERQLAPLWTRAGALLFTHGEKLYNFEGLRRYKEKFKPVWEPRYLAAPGGLGPRRPSSPTSPSWSAAAPSGSCANRCAAPLRDTRGWHRARGRTR